MPLAVKCLTAERNGGFSSWKYPPIGKIWPTVPEPHECGYNGYWVLTTRAQVLDWLRETTSQRYVKLALCHASLAKRQTGDNKSSATTGRIVSEAKIPAYAAWGEAKTAWGKAKRSAA